MEIVKKCAVIVVSHSMPNLTRLSTNILLLNKGKNIFLGNNVVKGIEMYYEQFPNEKTQIIGDKGIILNNCHIHSQSAVNKVNYLDDLFIEIDFTLKKENCVDVLSIEIFDEDLKFIAECFIDLPNVKKISKKNNKITVLLPKLQLSSGKYSVTIIFCKRRKESPNGQFITQYRSIAEFFVNNSITCTHAPFLIPGEIIHSS